MDAKELTEFFKGLGTTLADAISGSSSNGDEAEAKKAAEEKAEKEKADEKVATEKAAAEKKAADEKAEKGKGGDGDDPDVNKRLDDLEASIKSLDENASATREALEKTLETVEKLAGATAVRKGLIETDPEETTSEEDLKKGVRKDNVSLENAVAAVAGGATVRLN